MWSKLLTLLLILGLAITPASAELNYRLYEFTKLTGGLNDSFNAVTLDASEASTLQNIIFPRQINGAFGKRPGFTRLNSTALTGTPDCTGVFFFKLTDGTRYLVSVWSDDTIRKMDYLAGTGPDGTWDTITGSLSFAIGTDDHASFAVAENQLVIEDGLGTTAPYLWTGTGNATTLTADVDLPNSKYATYHRRHLFLAGNSTQLSRLYFSALGDITDYTTTDFINVEDNAGDGVIRGMATGLDGLYIWKDSAIWRLTGTSRDDFQLERMVQGIGTLHHQSIAIINSPKDNQQYFFFVTQNGDVAVYDGGITVEIISRKISQSVPKSIQYSRLDEMVGTAYEFTYMLSLSNTGSTAEHDRIYQYDLLHSAWTRFVGMEANAVGAYENDGGKSVFMFGDYDGRVNSWDMDDTSTTNDPGTTAIDAFWESGWMSFAEDGVLKDVRKVRIFANQQGTGQTLSVTVRKDFEPTGTLQTVSLAGSGSLWDTAVWDTDRYADLSVVIGEVEPNTGENVFLLRVENSSASQTFRIRKIQFITEPKERV